MRDEHVVVAAIWGVLLGLFVLGSAAVLLYFERTSWRYKRQLRRLGQNAKASIPSNASSLSLVGPKHEPAVGSLASTPLFTTPPYAYAWDRPALETGLFKPTPQATTQTREVQRALPSHPFLRPQSGQIARADHPPPPSSLE